MDYKKSGVDIEAGYKSVELMKEAVKSTMREEVLGGIGGFSGAFSLAKIKEMEEPVLLSGTDGCGTKVKLAFIMDKHDTIGIDAVAMCVNDVVCAGGEPLFFLDYIACGKNYPEKIATIVGGVAEGCRQSECALIGGETAEHPGLMPQDEYDLAGFAVGVVDKKDLITGENIKPGDTLIGIASSGVHSNGFSLVRSVFTMTEESLNTYYDSLGKTLGEALLAPTKIYVKTMKEKEEYFENLKVLKSTIIQFRSCIVSIPLSNTIQTHIKIVFQYHSTLLGIPSSVRITRFTSQEVHESHLYSSRFCHPFFDSVTKTTVARTRQPGVSNCLTGIFVPGMFQKISLRQM